MDIQIITAPLIGGLIGLITNSLAIKMLFRPYKEIRIAGCRVPFTPGLIPKEKSRIAKAIAQVISNYILDRDTILAALASDSIKEAYEKKFEEKLNAWKAMDCTLEEILKKYNVEETANTMEVKLCDSVSNYLIGQCKQEELARKLVEHAFSSFKDNLNPFMYKMGKKALDGAQEVMITQFDDLIDTYGKEFVSGYIDKVYEEWLEKPVSEVVMLLEDKVSGFKQLLWEKYVEIVQNKFEQFLSALNIKEIIENKINDYDLQELENMIMEISEKELHALVWLGGLLGIIMGFVNLLF